jgi:hypothetical protein
VQEPSRQKYWNCRRRPPVLAITVRNLWGGKQGERTFFSVVSQAEPIEQGCIS